MNKAECKKEVDFFSWKDYYEWSNEKSCIIKREQKTLKTIVF